MPPAARVLIVTCSGFSPTAAAAAAWSPVWNWQPAQISHLSGLNRHTAVKGSIVACARYGNSNSPSTRFTACASAASASPTSFTVRASFPRPRARYSFMSSVVPRFSASDSSQVTLNASRPFFADHMSRPTTATPRGICTTSTTPATAFALVASNELARAPKRGGRMTTAVIISGSITSIANCCLPVDFARASSRGSFSLPTILKSVGFLRGTFAGTGSFAAAPASSPRVALRPVPACDTTPSLTVMSVAGTPQRAAAAATSIARAVAPASRSCCQELATAVDPPVSCAWAPIGTKARFWYVGTSAGALSTRIWAQEASSSSATIAGSPVHTPCPASRCLEITVTVLSGATRTNGIVSGPAALPAPGCEPQPGSIMPSVSPEPASEVSCRNCRRVSSGGEGEVAGDAALSSSM